MNPRITQKCCTMHEQILKLNTENENLQKKNMQLHEQHADFQEQMRQLKTSQNDLSLKLLQSEEERDKVHKALFKMQVQEKLQKEERETETFELESKVLVLENELVRVELQRDSDYQELVLANAWLSALEKDYQELSTQHLALKNKEHEPCKPSATEQEMKTVVADQLETKVQEEIECIKTCYMRRQNKLEEKLISIDKERQEAKEKVKDFQHKMAEQATAELVSKSQQKEVQAENSKLQLRLKQLSEDYRARLLRCLHDLAKHVDLSAKVEVKKSGKKIDYGKDDADQVRKLLEEMITEIRSTYKAREEQLARAVRSYKKRMHNVVVQHQQLLAAYRLARDQVLTFGPAGSDPGPPEACFILFDGARQSALARQLMELQRDKAQLEAELAVMRDHFKRHKCQIMAKREGNENTPDKKHQLNLEKQLKDFTIPAYTGRLGEGACKATESSSDSRGDACRDAKNMLTLSSCNKNKT